MKYNDEDNRGPSRVNELQLMVTLNIRMWENMISVTLTLVVLLRPDRVNCSNASKTSIHLGFPLRTLSRVQMTVQKTSEQRLCA